MGSFYIGEISLAINSRRSGVFGISYFVHDSRDKLERILYVGQRTAKFDK